MPRKRRAAPSPPPPPEPVVVDACRCDCCACELGVGRAQSDGYCPFCAERCYPAAALPGGGYTRVVFDRPSRERLHETFGGQDAAEIEPPADPTQQLLQHAAYTLGQMARPHVQRLIKQGIKKVLG